MSMLFCCFTTQAMEPPLILPINNNPSPIQQPSLFPSLPYPNTHKPILGFEIKDLAQLAPIAIAMYCFNEFPRFTMISLSIMLIYTISAKEIFKSQKKHLVAKLKKFCKKIYRSFTGPFE